MIIKLN